MRNYIHPNHMDMRQYGTGSRRDSRTGKGRYDLISPHATKRLALRLEFGVEKYGERNWEKGQPMDDFFDSAKRHMDNWQMGDTSEDHLAAAYWNLHCMLHFDSVVHVYERRCTKCNRVHSVFDGKGVCIACKSSEVVSDTSFGEVIEPRAPVSPSKPPEMPSKVFVPIPSKDGLGGDTARQKLYDQHSASETAEMIRREEYRETFRHTFRPNEQLTLEGLAKYD